MSKPTRLSRGFPAPLRCRHATAVSTSGADQIFFFFLAVRIKKTKKVTKFKVRTAKYLYTLSITDPTKVDKLKQSLPPGACFFISV